MSLPTWHHKDLEAVPARGLFLLSDSYSVGLVNISKAPNPLFKPLAPSSYLIPKSTPHSLAALLSIPPELPWPCALQ